MNTAYVVYVEGENVFVTDQLPLALREWDARTNGRSVAGGVSVQSFQDGLMVRDGWILHVHDDRSVYINPGLQEAS